MSATFATGDRRAAECAAPGACSCLPAFLEPGLPVRVLASSDDSGENVAAKASDTFLMLCTDLTGADFYNAADQLLLRADAASAALSELTLQADHFIFSNEQSAVGTESGRECS